MMCVFYGSLCVDYCLLHIVGCVVVLCVWCLLYGVRDCSVDECYGCLVCAVCCAFVVVWCMLRDDCLVDKQHVAIIKHQLTNNIAGTTYNIPVNIHTPSHSTQHTLYNTHDTTTDSYHNPCNHGQHATNNKNAK